MPAIPFPQTSSPNSDPQDSGGVLVNCYLDAAAGKSDKIWRKSAGLNQLVNTDGLVSRGLLEVGSYLYCVYSNSLLRVNSSYAVTSIGPVAGSLPVTMARNMRAPAPQIVIVNEYNVLVYDTNTSLFTQLLDDDLGLPNSVCFIDGYFIFTYSDGRARSSGLNDITINSLDLATAEANPDGLLRGVAYRRELYLMGNSTIEVWQNVGNETGFPFSRSTVIQQGLIGTHAVAGFEDGWSGALLWVGSDGVVYAMNGYTPQPVGQASVHRDIQSTPDKSKIRAHVYTVRDNAFFVLSSPDWTWEMNLLTGAWNQRKSYGQSRWRVATTCKAFDKWIGGDVLTGDLYEISDVYKGEYNDPLVWEMISGNMSAFPDRMNITNVDLDFIVARGQAGGSNITQTAPRISFSWSYDGGVTFSHEVLREIGKQGEYAKTVRINRLGLCTQRGFRAKVVASDPRVDGFFGGTFDYIARGL